MSYILDALKKSSEERRRRQQEEELQSPLLLDHPVSRETSGKNRLLPILLTITLVIVSISGWQFFSLRTEGPVHPSNPEQAAPTLPGQKPEERTTEGLRPDSTHPLVQPAPKAPVTDETADDVAEKPSPENPEAKTKPGLALLEELPLSIRAQLPEMKYSGHVFSPNPQLRMILINTTVVREGDLIDDNTRLLEITSDGLVMSFKGTKFKVVLF